MVDISATLTGTRDTFQGPFFFDGGISFGGDFALPFRIPGSEEGDNAGGGPGGGSIRLCGLAGGGFDGGGEGVSGAGSALTGTGDDGVFGLSPQALLKSPATIT